MRGAADANNFSINMENHKRKRKIIIHAKYTVTNLLQVQVGLCSSSLKVFNKNQLHILPFQGFI